ncbi:hypothetical protein F383_34849 [Gossypium arboreum]|nr:hypothetical protein F383_34849 [Gossypium arboreum]
MSIWQN